MTSSIQTTYFAQIDGTTPGSFNITGATLKINQEAQNNINMSNILNASTPLKTRFTIIDNFNNEAVLVSNGAAFVNGTEIEIPINQLSAIGAFTIGSTCYVNIDYARDFNELRGIEITAPSNNNLLVYNGTQWVNSPTINVSTLSGILPLNNGGTNSTALNLLNGTMVCSSAGSLQGLKQTPSGQVVGTTDAQTLTNKIMTDASNSCRATQIYSVQMPAAAPLANQKLKTSSATTSSWTNDELNELNDVTLGTGAFLPLSGDQLTYTGSVWTNLTNILGGIQFFNNVTATIIPAINTDVKLAGTYVLNTNSFQFILGGSPINSLQCIDGFTWICQLYYQASLTAATNNENVEISIYKNGVKNTDSVAKATTSNSGRYTSLSGMIWITMQADDTLELFCANNSNNSNITAQSAKIYATALRLQ